MSSERRRILLIEAQPRIPQPVVLTTLNPADKDSTITLSGSNYIATKNAVHATAWGGVRSLIKFGPGKWYWETAANYSGSANGVWGLARATALLTIQPGTTGGVYDALMGPDKTGVMYYGGLFFPSFGAITSGTRLRHRFNGETTTYEVDNGSNTWITVGTADLFPKFNEQVYIIYAGFRPSGTTASGQLYVDPLTFTYAVPDGYNSGVYSIPAPVATTIYLGSEKFNTGAADTPANQEYMSRLSKDGDVITDRNVSCWVWGDQSESSRGEIVVVNKDGALDAWLGWEWRDALVTYYAGYDGDARSAFVAYATNVVDTFELNTEKQIVLTLADQLAQIDKQMQTVLYDDTTLNPQLIGQPVPMVMGRPVYVSGALLNTSIIVRDYQLHDGFTEGILGGVTNYIASIDALYDRGNLFRGPDDSFSVHNSMTALNGGAFGSWTGTAPNTIPANWTALTDMTTTDRFYDFGSSVLGMKSSGQVVTIIFHSASSLNADTEYTIAFTVTNATIPGPITFRAGSVDVPYTIASTGAKTVTIVTREAAQLQIILGLPNSNATVKRISAALDNMTVTSVQHIDWTYWTDNTHRLGFHLNNPPRGKVVANVVGPKIYSTVIEYLPQVVQMIRARAWNSYGAIVGWAYNTGSVTALNVLYPYRLASFDDKPITLLEFWRATMDCFCGWVIPRRDGQFVVGNVQDPVASASVLDLDETTVQSIRIYIDTAPGLTRRLSGRKNNTKHELTDLYSTIMDPLSDLYNPALAAELTSDYTVTRQGAPTLTPGDNAPLSAAYAQAINAPAKETMLQDAVQIQAEINRVCTLWRPQRCFIDVECVLSATAADALEPGQVVGLSWKYTAGLVTKKYFMVKRVRTGFFSRQVSLVLWGRVPT